MRELQTFCALAKLRVHALDHWHSVQFTDRLCQMQPTGAIRESNKSAAAICTDLKVVIQLVLLLLKPAADNDELLPDTRQTAPRSAFRLLMAASQRDTDDATRYYSRQARCRHKTGKILRLLQPKLLPLLQ